jgi:hypothetical protein
MNGKLTTSTIALCTPIISSAWKLTPEIVNGLEPGTPGTYLPIKRGSVYTTNPTTPGNGYITMALTSGTMKLMIGDP